MNNKERHTLDKMAFMTGSIAHSIVYFVTGKIPFKLLCIFLSKEFLEKEWTNYHDKGVL